MDILRGLNGRGINKLRKERRKNAAAYQSDGLSREN